jgi:CBS domain-containing protein
MDPEANSAERMRALTGAMMDREKAGLPVHKWKLATTKEAGSWSQNFFTVDQFMTTDLVTVHEDELIDLCASLMRWRKIDQVPVEDDDQRLVGLVAVSEVLKLVEVGLPEGEGLHVSAQSVMDPNPVTIPADTRTLDAIELMREKQLECLLVVDGDRLVGMLTEYDLGNIARQLLTERLQAGD